jgi:DNA-binding MarR family transcriptional regulator
MSSTTRDSSTPRGCTNLQLRLLSHRVDRRYAEALASAGLTTSQYGLLGQIEAFGPLRPADLAVRMGLDPSTLTRNLQGLVAAGWVAQVPGADRRSRQVLLTDAGRQRRQDAKRAWKQAQLALNQRLGVERVLQLHALIDDCMTALDADETAG